MVYKKFESIKLQIMQGRKLKPFQTARVIQDHEDRLKALEEANGGSNGSSQQQETPTPTPTTRDLSFTINDGTNPIEGATVAIGTKTSTTGSAGGCSINGVAEGEVSVEVSKEGYTTKTETITVDSTHTSFTISLVVVSSP